MADLSQLQAFAEEKLSQALEPGQPMPGGGSARRFYRFRGGGSSWIGVIGSHAAENRAFLGFTLHFGGQGLPVPRIYAVDREQGFYLMEDLGDTTLAAQLAQFRGHPAGRVIAMATLHRIVGWLPRFQVHGGEGLDYGLCHEGEELDGEVFAADVRRFIDEYIPRHAKGSEPEERVLIELEVLITRLHSMPREHFCYRDFQPRNIMWRDGPVFLDYQSGRRGALHYDLASFLYSPDTGLGEKERVQLIDVYLKALRDCGVAMDHISFLADFHPIVLVRRLQALGAYAQIGATEGKEDYLQYITPSLADLGQLLSQGKLSMGLPALEAWLKRIVMAGLKTAGGG
ncbi:MAG: phosphotransferase [SAR324 cluster bacterium]|nr:phosphotransferase [SAR324 cluster bacterium]